MSYLFLFAFFIASLSASDIFIQNIHLKVLDTIDHCDNVPGLKADEFHVIKEGIKGRLDELVHKGILEITATDKEVRPYFVSIQGLVEHVLAHELGISVFKLKGYIHTPMPATPLCTEGSISNELVNPSIQDDPLRLFTVKARSTILRDYLFKGGRLYVFYPKEGMSKRSDTQQQIYLSELKKYPLNLFDRPLVCDSIESELVGAFYLFSNGEGKTYAFAIKMNQANNQQELGSFGLWLGEFKEGTNAFDRISTIIEKVLIHSPNSFEL